MNLIEKLIILKEKNCDLFKIPEANMYCAKCGNKMEKNKKQYGIICVKCSFEIKLLID